MNGVLEKLERRVPGRKIRNGVDHYEPRESVGTGEVISDDVAFRVASEVPLDIGRRRLSVPIAFTLDEIDVSDVTEGTDPMFSVTPGEILREDCMEPLGLSVDALARAL